MSPTIETAKNPETMAPAPANIESQSPSYTPVAQGTRRADLMKKSQVVLRTIGLLFSFVSFVIMASNNHGLTYDGFVYASNNFSDYYGYRYLLAVAIIATVYTLFQVVRQIVEFSTGMYMLSQRGLNLLDFIGDQLVAYLLFSAPSTAVTVAQVTNNSLALSAFLSQSAASISMAFLAFVPMALSAMISGYKLSTQSYI